MLERTSPTTQAFTNGCAIAARSENDTGNNPHNPMYGILKAGAGGELLNLIGSQASDSGGNSMAPAALIDLPTGADEGGSRERRHRPRRYRRARQDAAEGRRERRARGDDRAVRRPQSGPHRIEASGSKLDNATISVVRDAALQSSRCAART